LMDTQQPGYDVPISIIAAFAVSSGALSLFAVGAAVRARNQEVVTGKDAMVGKQAEALEDFESQGWVRAFGEIWQAESTKPVKEQAVLKIVAVDGLILKVQPEDG
ncbi:MAG: nodulation protein NfeD, partial [Gammaproteobacteria bacterium]|nr:nodulation protein NfeD [Gammaproteobacteria bacterium]